MPKELDLALLRAFVEVVSTSSMTLAARRLHLTQGAISQQVRRLEEQLGRSLLIRSRSGLTPTEYGRDLIIQAKDMLSLNDRIWRDAEAYDGAPAIRIGAPPDLFGKTVCPLINRYKKYFPGSKIILACAPSPLLSQRLAQNDIDMAIVEEPEGQEVGDRILSDQLVWVGAQGGDAHTLKMLPVALVDRECVFRPDMMAALKTEGRPWETVFENGSIDATASAVRADLAVTAWLHSTIPQGLIALRDKTLPDLPRYSVSLRSAPRVKDHLTMRVEDFIRSELKSLSRN